MCLPHGGTLVHGSVHLVLYVLPDATYFVGFRIVKIVNSLRRELSLFCCGPALVFSRENIDFILPVSTRQARCRNLRVDAFPSAKWRMLLAAVFALGVEIVCAFPSLGIKASFRWKPGRLERFASL